jgi:hypothetical protein
MCLTPKGVNSAFMVYTDLKKRVSRKAQGKPTHPVNLDGNR